MVSELIIVPLLENQSDQTFEDRSKVRLMVPLLVMTAAFIGLARALATAFPVDTPIEEAELLLDPSVIGLALQEQLFPLALVCWLASTPRFRRALDQRSPLPGLLPGFMAIMFFSTVIRVGIQTGYDQEATFGALPLVVGALFGGRKLGLSLGVYGYLLGGLGVILSIAREPDDTFMSLIQEGYVLDFATISLVWVGFCAGTLGEFFGSQKLQLRPLIITGLTCELGSVAMIAIADGDPGLLTFLGLGGLAVTCLAMTVVYLSLRSAQKELQEERARQAELANLQAQLTALRAQINPHFLFNSLNTIRYFVRTDADAARRLLLDLSDVLKSAMSSQDLIPLEKELALVEAYLNLEKARLGERLQTEIDVDSALLDRSVPSLFLQPLIENAVKHGIGSKVEGGVVALRVFKSEEQMVVEVSDNGVGLGAETEHEGHGIGLDNVSRRLRGHFGEEAKLEYLPVEVGTKIRLTLPARLGHAAK